MHCDYLNQRHGAVPAHDRKCAVASLQVRSQGMGMGKCKLPEHQLAHTYGKSILHVTARPVPKKSYQNCMQP